MCIYFWHLLNKIGWCTWGTIPFAHRIIKGQIYDLCFEIKLESTKYKEDTRQFHTLVLDKDLEALETYYDNHKDLYRGSAEWDAGFPVRIQRLKVLGK